MNAILETPPTVKLDAPGQPALENARGFRVQQLEYGAPPQIDARAYAAAGNSGWGKTLYKLGGDLNNVHKARELMKEADRTQKLGEADLYLDRMKEDVVADLASDQHRDHPEGWGARLMGHLKHAATVLLHGKDVDPQLKTELQQRMAPWQEKLTREVDASAVGRKVELAAQT